MKPHEFDDELRALDREFEAGGMPADVDARLRARLERPTRQLQWRPLVLGVALATAAAVLLVLVGRPANVGGLVVEQPSGFSAEADASATITVTAGTATLRDLALQATLQVEPGVQLSREGRGAAVRRGRVRFEVARLDSRVASYSVTVSHGVIEVIGTSFIVQQGDASGSVELLEGTIRFVATDGRTVTLAAGETLRWPLPVVEVAPQPEPTTPSPDPTPVVPRPAPKPLQLTPAAPTAEPAKPFSSEAVLARVATLRSRRAYEEAVMVLNAALTEAPNASTRERLGFELGSLLTHQLRDVPRACAFWRAFRLEHPQSRYAEELASTVAGLGCQSP